MADKERNDIERVFCLAILPEGVDVVLRILKRHEDLKRRLKTCTIEDIIGKEQPNDQ